MAKLRKTELKMTEKIIKKSKTQQKEWERMPAESDQAWGAFCAYRDLGSVRTLPEAYRLYCEKSSRKRKRNVPTHWYSWAERYDWAGRVRGYDDEIEREMLEIARERMKEWREESVGMMMCLQGRMLSLLQGWEESSPDVRELNLATNAAIALIREGERLLILGVEEKEIGDVGVLDVHWHVHGR